MPILVAALRKRYTALACFVSILIVVISISSSNWISKSFFPNVEDDELTIQINLPSGSPFSRTEEIGRKVQTAGYQVIEFYKDKDNAIKGILLTLNENKIMAYVNLHDPSIRDASAKEIAKLYREYIGDVPDAENFAIGTQIGRNSTAADLELSLIHISEPTRPY